MNISKVKKNTAGKNAAGRGVTVIALICLLLLMCTVLFGCKSSNNVAEIENGSGKVVGEIDQKLMSLIMSVSNSQLGAEAYAGTDIWNTTYPGSDKTVKDIVVAQARAYAVGLLQAEQLCDTVYGSGLSKEQISFVDSYIDELTTVYGGAKGFESVLSSYGTDVEALKRYMLLVIKRDAVYKTLYTQETGTRYPDIQSAKKDYFAKNFFVEDHILIKYSGGMKADGTEIPLSPEQQQAKREAAKALYAEIQNGVRTFDEALAEFGEDTYVLGYPFGYFISRDFDWSGMPSVVQSAVREMTEGEIRFVDAETGAYIVRKNQMNPELYKSNGNFDLYLESTIAQEDFLLQCEYAGDVNVDEELLAELDPENIPAFDMSLLGQE